MSVEGGLPRIPVIAGPTASGKTELSIRLAQKLDGEIVSADSMQLYRYMDIGTAKPTEAERAGIPHHMLDLLLPCEEYSVAQYAEAARACIRDILARGRQPVVVGGTGQYINALVDNIRYDETEPDPALCAELEAYVRENGAQALHMRLREADPAAAEAIHVNNVKRVLRALAMTLSGGGTLQERNERSRSAPPEFAWTVYALDLPRQALYDRIDRRVDRMMRDGLADEVRAISEMGMGRTARQAIGYKEILDTFTGARSLEEAVDAIKQGSRHYAKRQITWFRKPAWVQWREAEDIRRYYGL